ncbi:c-type cytochrome [Chitinophaga pinensis]|uniref:c-type cytochrome n=1 Tax=Chitinophaga pinensis TaxID=79329 RepID=UPI001C99B3E5|nr:cytochrome c [Chitinophaga pinensis]
MAASGAQFLIGPIVLFTLPAKGLGWNLVAVILAGAAIAIPAMIWIWKAINGPEEKIDRHFGKVVLALSLTVLFMGSGRQIYRANALAPHQQLMAAKTEEFKRLSAEARANSQETDPAPEIDTSLGAVAKGAALFKMHCSACHQKDTKLVGPPMLEMVEIYKGQADKLKDWIRNPGKKRPDYPHMPAFGDRLSADDLQELAEYILSVK